MINFTTNDYVSNLFSIFSLGLYVSYLNDLPRTRRFYGRTKEIDVMAELLDAKSASILVPGIAGIGKTSLSTKTWIDSLIGGI